MGRNDELRQQINDLAQPFLDELRRTITSSLTVNERGAHRVSCPAAGVGVGKIATTVSNELKGYSFRETTGAAVATVLLRDGTDANGEIVATIAIPAGGSKEIFYAGTGVSLINGLFVDRVAGASEGAVYLRSGGAS